MTRSGLETNHPGKPRVSVRMAAWNWFSIRALRSEGGTPASVSRDSRFSRDVVSAVFADVPAQVRYRICRRCSASNRFRDRNCRQCGEPMNAKDTGFAEIALVIREEISQAQPKELILIGRHKAGEICIPKGSKATKIFIYSGPLASADTAAFSQLHTRNGQPVWLDVCGGCNFEIPLAAFACHRIALVADVQTPATLRLKG